MSSQNRMNAGAEYVLYRIWATLQGRDGIHAESLLACLGALAGYACQAYVRRAGSRGNTANAHKFALTPTMAQDGSTYLDGDALRLPLTTSPLSVWMLVRRAVQKRGGSLPDIEDISAHVTRTLGTSAFGLPRVPDEHRPRLLPVVYLTQLWPQILPIAQRFCRRPAQLPVLFGIALQRAIEHTAERLNPALGATIAMECAVAMSKVTLPAPLSDLFQAPPATPDIAVTPKPATTSSFPEIRTTRKRRARDFDPHALEPGFFSTRMRSTKVVATLLSLAIVAITSAAWKTDKEEAAPTIARLEAGLKASAFRAVATASAFEQPMQPVQVDEEAPPAEEMPPRQEPFQPSPEDADLPAPAPDLGEGIIAEDWQSA